MTPPSTSFYRSPTGGSVHLQTVTIECTNGSVEYAICLHTMDDTIVVTDLLLYWRHWFQLVHPNLPHKFPSITVKNGYTAAEILDQWTDG